MLSEQLGSAPSAAARRHLAVAVSPGRRRLTAAAALTTASVVGTAACFFAVAAIAQDVLDRDPTWSHETAWLLLLAAGAGMRAAAAYLAAGQASDGALAVERRLRGRLLDRLLGGAGSSLSSAAKATAAIDEVERVGAYAERYQPARLAAVLVPLVLLAAVFPLSWPVGVLLLLCLPLPPLNLSIVGMGTAAVAERHGEELRHLSGYFRDRLRGLATLRALDAERAELERVRAASERLAASSMAVLRVAFVSAAVLEAIVTVAIAMVAMFIGLTLLGYMQLPGLPSQMSLRTGLFLLMVTPLYFQPVRALAQPGDRRALYSARRRAVDQRAAGSGPELRGEHPQQRRLPRPGSAGESDHLAGLDRQRHALERRRLAPGELDGDLIELDRWRCGERPPGMVLGRGAGVLEERCQRLDCRQRVGALVVGGGQRPHRLEVKRRHHQQEEAGPQ